MDDNESNKVEAPRPPVLHATSNETINIDVNKEPLFAEIQPYSSMESPSASSIESFNSCDSLVPQTRLIDLDEIVEKSDIHNSLGECLSPTKTNTDSNDQNSWIIQAKTPPAANTILSVVSQPRSSTRTPLFNPYAKTNKRQRGTLDSDNSPGSQAVPVDIKDIIPGSFDSFDTFFAVLLRTSISEYIASGTDDISSYELWKKLCNRVGIPILLNKIPPILLDVKVFFSSRASLILEEAREVLTNVLVERRLRRRNDASTILVRLNKIKETEHQRTNFQFQSVFYPEKMFSPIEKKLLRSGTIFQCIHEQDYDDSSVMLGCIVPSEKALMNKKAAFEMRFFKPLPSYMTREGSTWKVIPIDNFLPLMRQFAAVHEMHSLSIAFLDPLMGLQLNNKPTSSSFEDLPLDLSKIISIAESSFLGVGNDFGNDRSNTCQDESIKIKRECPSMSSLKLSKVKEKLLPLNEMQKVAVQSFIDSVPGSITIVQGPPGTGKTTLLLHTIVDYLTKLRNEETTTNKSEKNRILVCAPTNKAILVIASRFVKKIDDSSINMVVIGDNEKLLTCDEESALLRPHFAYEFQEFCSNIFQLTQNWCNPRAEFKERPTRSEVSAQIIWLKNLIIEKLRGLHKEFKDKLNDLCQRIESGESGKELFKFARAVHNEFAAFPSDTVLTDLLNSSDVLFCTLCSSGSSIMRKANAVDGLIIDEAGASTEPETFIPFHLKPQRLLIVGDPKQLPPIVSSSRASRLGLSTSLHERLMYGCKSPYTMLDTQYRMHPEIVSFPSSCFYDGKVRCDPSIKHSSSSLFGGQPYVFLNAGGREEKVAGGSSKNVKEAELVCDLVSQLAQHGLDIAVVDRIRVITFYLGQVALLKKCLDKNGQLVTEVGTVDSSQGCEADIVILSLVRTDSVGFLNDDRRLNVALTRARHQLICVGSVDRLGGMTGAVTLRKLAHDAKLRNVVLEPDG